jgi:hypothetical protein
MVAEQEQDNLNVVASLPFCNSAQRNIKNLLTFRALLNNYLPSPKGAYVPNDLCSCGIMC